MRHGDLSPGAAADSVIEMMMNRVRAENMRLRWEIERQKQDEERYMRLQYEVETLTSRLHKVISGGLIAVIETGSSH